MAAFYEQVKIYNLIDIINIYNGNRISIDYINSFYEHIVQINAMTLRNKQIGVGDFVSKRISSDFHWLDELYPCAIGSARTRAAPDPLNTPPTSILCDQVLADNEFFYFFVAMVGEYLR
jgi:hypothetical protein